MEREAECEHYYTIIYCTILYYPTLLLYYPHVKREAECEREFWRDVAARVGWREGGIVPRCAAQVHELDLPLAAEEGAMSLQRASGLV